MKLCKDCAFFSAENEECNNSLSIQSHDLLYGNHSKKSAKAMREDIDRCGFSGKLFAEKIILKNQSNFVEGLV
jgi:hypothetical protein